MATDRNGRVDFLNPAAERLMGWTSAEARGRPRVEVFAIFNEHTGAPAENPVDRVLRENIVVGLANHTVLRARDGRVRPIEDSAAPIRTADGEILGVILVFHDVSLKQESQRRMTEAAERASAARRASFPSRSGPPAPTANSTTRTRSVRTISGPTWTAR